MRRKLPKLKLLVAINEPEVLKKIGKDSIRNGTNKLTMRDIDRIIDATRVRRRKRE